MREGLQDNGHKEATANTSDESYFPITIYMEDIWLRETIHCAKGGILSLFYFRVRTKRAIFPFILA